jgi:aspartate aminotransferase
VKSPVEDDMEFIDTALKYNVLAVPGKGFGRAGYFRLSFCIDMETIRRSLAAWDKIAAEYF